MNRRALAERAAPFHETLRASAGVDPDASPRGIRTTSDRMAQWREVVARGDAQLFADRLRRSGLTEAQAEALVHARPAPASSEEPAWIAALAEAFGWNDESGPLVFTAADWPGTIDPDKPFAFESLLLPLVELARVRLVARSPTVIASLAPSVLSGMLRSLLQRLTQICAVALYADFSVARTPIAGQGLNAWLSGPATTAPDAEFQRFIRRALDDRLGGFFESYPVAGRLCGVAVDHWVAAIAEFFERLDADLPELSWVVGADVSLDAIVTIEVSAGDTHDGGRSVFIVRFANGTAVVYKPRAIPLEALFATLVAWVNQAGLDLDLCAPRHVARAGYGWIEFVHATHCADEDAAARFYYRSGMLLALVYTLHGTDFHLENLIAAGEYPVLIDMEALLSHRFELVPAGSAVGGSLHQARDFARESVLGTCMLPGIYIGQDGSVDIGGLAAMTDAEQSIVRTVWRDVNQDGMRLAREPGSKTAAKHNLPTVDGRQIDGATYVDEIAAGFRAVYRLVQERHDEILDSRGPLQALEGQGVRFLFRHTNLYATLLQRTLHPEYLRDGVDRAIQLEALARPLIASDARPVAWSLFADEVRALEQLDVPIFVANGDSGAIRLESGEEVTDCFRVTAVEQMRSRMSTLDDEDLARQVRFIRTSFAASAAHGLALSASSTTGGSLVTASAERKSVRRRAPCDVTDVCLDEAHAIARTTLDAAALWRDGTPAWFGIGYMPQSQRYGVGAAGLSLFDGIPGVALFLAALDQLDPTPDIRATAVHLADAMHVELEGLATLARSLPRLDIGAGTGLGGLLYAAIPVARWLDMPELLVAARAAASSVSQNLIATSRHNTILSGTAGGIIGFLALHEATGDADALIQAERCGRSLLASRRPYLDTGLSAWPGHNGRADVGLPLGLGGIAAALLRLSQATGVSEFAAAAAHGFALERSIRNARGSADASAVWCSGDIACAAARLLGGGSTDDGEADAAIEAGIVAASANESPALDSLCSGHMGRVEFLLHVGQRLGRSELVDRARTRGVARIERSRVAGWQTPWNAAHTDVGFFHGLSGIGYQCLRLAAPERLPSVLHWSSRPAVHATHVGVEGFPATVTEERQLAEVS